MRLRFSLLSCLSIILAFNLIAQTNDTALNAYIARSPFKMPAVTLPVIPVKQFNIKDYGGTPDGKTLNTVAFKKTINAAMDAGGGIVVVPAGEWLTGPIQLQSNIHLRVEKDALIQFTKDRTQYPMIKAGSKSSNLVPASPIYAYDCRNIAISGEGIIDGAGESWRPVKKSKTTVAQWEALVASGGVLSADKKIWWPSQEALDGEDFIRKFKSTGEKPSAENYLPARDFLRPYMVYFSNCENILLEDVTIRNSPKFVFYPNRCNHLTMKGVTVFNEWWAQNGDGIDISACKNVIIYQCKVSCGDDAICMKSSASTSDEPGTFALENILVADCKVQRGHGGFVIGSNTDGGMRNIFVTDCNLDGTDIGIRVKSNAGRGGLVKDIFISDIGMQNIIDEAILFDTYYADVPAGKAKEDDVSTMMNDKVPEFTAFFLSNISCAGAETAIKMKGLPQMPIHHIHFNKIAMISKRGVISENAANLSFNDAIFMTNEDPTFYLSNVKDIEINKTNKPDKTKLFMQANGNTSNIIIQASHIGDPNKTISLDKQIDTSNLVIK